MIKNREVLRMAGYLLDSPSRRCVATLALDCYECPVASLSQHACAWSLDGAVLAACHKLHARFLECTADLVTLFGTKNYASHWDRSLSCPRWTQDEMVEMLKCL